MKSKVICCMFLFVVAVLSPCGKAGLWNPDDAVVFNMNFENDTNVTQTFPPSYPSGRPTTTEAGPSHLVGTASDYNDRDSNNLFHMWNAPTSRWRCQPADQNNDPNMAKIGNFVGDFKKMGDFNTGKLYDACVMMPYNDDIFGLGVYGEEETHKKTFAFWFWPEVLQGTLSGTFIRHAKADDKNYWWEIRMDEGKLKFIHVQNCLRMETEDALADLGVQGNTWHHAAVVIDRTTEQGSQIFIDGVKVGKIVTAYNALSPYIGEDPVKFGGGGVQGDGSGAEYDGLLDEFRIYNTPLSDSEVSILYQTDYKPHAFALKPYPNASIVPVTTDIEWYPDPNAVRQTLYFGTYSDACTNPLYTVSGANDMNSATNAAITGPLGLGVTYYWAVDTNVGSVVNKGPVWKFTTEDGKAYDPNPPSGTENIPTGTVNLQWTGCPSAVGYNVYFSNNQADVVSKAEGALVTTDGDITVTNFEVTASVNAENYYWRVVSTMSEESEKSPVDSDVWTFRTEPYVIIFNTNNSDVNYTYSGGIHTVGAYKCDVLGTGGWTTISNGAIDANSDDDVNVAVFDFNSFDYNLRYGIVVLPVYDAGTDFNIINITPLAIHVAGDFNFDGKMDISGDDVIYSGSDEEVNAPARCGGHRGPRPVNSDGTLIHEKENGYYDSFELKPANSRVGEEPKNKPRWEVNSVYGVPVFGIGAGTTASYTSGGGGGYGGMGGISGRGFYYAQWNGGVTYGDKEVPMPFGGSAGGFGKNVGTGGAAGGGGVEIVATGSVILGSNAQILAHGGGVIPEYTYQGGGGSGGSVRIIADGNVINRGIIDVNGGKGGNSTKQANENGGGGGGGRVAIFYGGTSCDANRITAKGGAAGLATLNTGTNAGLTIADNGEDGTIYVVKSSPVRRTASAPTPKNSDRMVYCPNSTSGNWLRLKWYSGYNATPANDIVYFRQGSAPTDSVTYQVGAPVPALRGQRNATVDVNIIPNQTYYFKVRTKPTDASGDANTVTWSFKTVNWKCKAPYDTKDPNTTTDPNNYYPIWDSYPPDCVVNSTDLPFFAKHWGEWRGEGDGRNYTVEPWDLYQLSLLWMECKGRTNNGCDTPVDW